MSRDLIFCTSVPFMVMLRILSRLGGTAGALTVLGVVGTLGRAFREVTMAQQCCGTAGGDSGPCDRAGGRRGSARGGGGPSRPGGGGVEGVSDWMLFRRAILCSSTTMVMRSASFSRSAGSFLLLLVGGRLAEWLTTLANP